MELGQQTDRPDKAEILTVGEAYEDGPGIYEALTGTVAPRSGPLFIGWHFGACKVGAEMDEHGNLRRLAGYTPAELCEIAREHGKWFPMSARSTE